MHFHEYSKHTGAGMTLGALVFTNLSIYLCWQVGAKHLETWSIMDRHFVARPGLLDHTVLTSAFSHKELRHLTNNMAFLLVVGPRLHAFLGRARFLALYSFGALAGAAAKQVDSTDDACYVAGTALRYFNVLEGRSPDTSRGCLGASGGTIALGAVFFFTFPLQRLPIFNIFHVLVIALRCMS